MPNTKIGKGSVVAAFSYVKGDFPDFSIIAGNPAKVIGDTRQLDEPYLKENHQLRTFYDKWVSQK
jgi:acetyltransferase-like isoleucine patch superfamily enzyme